MRKILIVEDEQSIAQSLEFVLSNEGFTTHWVSLAAEVIDYVRQDDIDLVILDVGLPDFSGFEVCKKIRKFSEVPIVFLTARGDEIDRVVGLEIGGDDYVVKPFIDPVDLYVQKDRSMRYAILFIVLTFVGFFPV